jgi:hypothetical protein
MTQYILKSSGGRYLESLTQHEVEYTVIEDKAKRFTTPSKARTAKEKMGKLDSKQITIQWTVQPVNDEKASV